MDKSHNLLNITLNIADKQYPLKIKPEEEESIRKAAKLINEKLKEFRQQYDGEKEDYLVMTALYFTVENINRANQSQNKDTGLTNRLNELDEILDDILSKRS